MGVVDVEGSFAQQEAVAIFVVKRRPGALNPRHRSASSLSRTAFPLPTALEDLETSTTTTSPGRSTPLWEGEPLEVGRALVNYSAVEIKRIMGHQTTEISGLLGYADSEYVALRENIAFLKVGGGSGSSRPTTPAPMWEGDESPLVPAASLAGYLNMSIAGDGFVTPRTP